MITKVGKAAKLLKAIRGLRPGIKTGLVGGLAFGGAAQGLYQGQPGHRIDAAKEGAIHGALIGGVALVGAYKGKKLARKAAVMGKRKGKLIFRKIRGRIVPIGRK